MAIDLKYHGPGQPTKLTPEIKKKIYDLVADGNYISVACRACKLSDSTFYKWMDKAKHFQHVYIDNNNIDILSDDDINNIPDDLKQAYEFWQFFQDLKQAEALAITKLSGYVLDHAPKNPIAAITLLERRHPDMYGRREAVSDSTNHGVELLQALAEILKGNTPQLKSGKSID